MRICLWGLLALLAAFLPLRTAQACDACGCAANLNLMGALPAGGRNLVSLRLRTMAYDIHSESTATRYAIRRAEFFARLRLGGRFSLTAIVPYAEIRNVENVSTGSRTGMGDPLALVSYTLLTRSDSSGKVQHQLQVGLGGKAPLGAYDATRQSGLSANAQALQLGSGSWDAVAAAAYRLAAGRWGLSTEANIKLNGRNKTGYQFGSQGNTTVNFYRSFFLAYRRTSLFTLLPQLGGYAEAAQRDNFQNILHKYTGGWAFYALGGVDGFTNRLGLGIRAYLPVTQHLLAGQAVAKPQINLMVTVFF